MSVYQRKRQKGSPVWRYEFVIQGARFLSPTHYPTRRAAEAAERVRRQRVAEGKDDSHEELTLDQAAGLWWRDKGAHLRSATILHRRIETVLELIGKTRRVVDIKFATVNEAIHQRRKQLVHGRPASNATINRDIIDTLRPILRHAAKVHELRMPAIEWGALRLEEADEVTREYSDAEIERWAEALPPVERFFLSLALTYGPRFGELFFPLDALSFDDPAEPRLRIGRYKGRAGWMPSRKDGSVLTLPIDPADAQIIAALAKRAGEAGLETIWFEPKGPTGGPQALAEISYWQMRHRLVKAASAAGIAPGRVIHGMRHHAGTAILRATQNLMMAKRLLGHRQVTTTQRYAHVSDADLKGGLARVSRQKHDASLRALPKPTKNQSDKG